MATSVTHTQTRSVTGGNLYRTVDAVTAAVGIQTTVFLFRVSDDAFMNVCSVHDVLTYPNTKAQAITDNLPYYRLAVVTKDYAAVDAAQEFGATLKASLKKLMVDYDAAVNGFVGTETTTISS